jgi:hypothetical protein
MNALGSSDLTAQVYDNLSLAARLAAGVKNRANSWAYSRWLHNYDRKLAELVDNIHALIEGRKKLPRVEQDAEPITPEGMRETADNLEHMSRMIDYVYESSRRAGLTNNSRTAAPLRRLQKNSEELRDFADWIETSLATKHNEEMFSRAAREKESGEVYDLSEV